MAEAIVGPLLIKLQDVAITEAKKLAAVGGEIEKLSDKLMWLQAMVHETDLRSRHDGSRLVRVLACQIRDVAFEAEDSVDEFYLRGDLSRRFGLSRHFGRNWWRATLEFIINFRTHICVRENAVSFKVTQVSKVNELKEKLMDESGSIVIHICGVGGVGKRALLVFAFEDESIKEHFRVCVCVSFPPGIRDNSGIIVNRIEEKLDKACSWCNTARRDARCLVIIKSPSRTTTWSQVESKLRAGQGSKILLTEASRHEEPNPSSSINLGPLDNARSISFFNHVYGLGGRRGTDYQTREMNKIRLRIMEITNGLPLAIVLAKLMRTMDFSKWEAAAAYLMSNNEDSKLKTILSVCIDDLPDELKSCLLYTAGFPKNGVIDAHQLVRLWMAEGFLTHQQGMETEQLGQCYLKELIYRGLLEPIEKTRAHGGRIESVAIHDEIHHLLRLEAKRTSFIDVHHGGCIPPPATTRRLAVQNKYINKSLALSNSLGKLRTIVSYSSDDYPDHETGSEQTNESINDSPTFIRKLLHGSPFMRVMNLEGVNVISKVPDEIGEMVHLQYIGIRRCRSVAKVPSSIGNLGRLQTIDVRDTKVRKLPKSLWKIRTLRHVLGNDLVFPASTGDLKFMQTLQSVTIQQEGVHRAMWWCTSAGRRRKQFGLGLLQSLRIVGLDASQQEELATILKGFSSLESLSLSGDGIPIDLFATESSYLDHVASLELDGQLLPPNPYYNYFCDSDACRAVLNNLTRLVLRRTNIAQDFIHSIAKLPLLAELKMQEGSYAEEKVVFCTRGFNSLAVLRITSLVTLKIVTAPGVTTRRHKVIQPIYTDMPESHSESHDSSCCGFCNARGQAGDNKANRNEEESHLALQITADHDVVPLVLPPAVESQINGGEQGDEGCDGVAMLPAGEKNDSGREEEDGMASLPQTDHEKQANEGMPVSPAKEKQASGGEEEEEEEDEGEHYEEMILDAINGLLKEDESSKTNKTTIREYIVEKKGSNLPETRVLRKLINQHLNNMVESGTLVKSGRYNYLCSEPQH